MRAKGVDLLVANDVAEDGSGFGTDTNRVTIYQPGAEPDPWPMLTKREVADRLLDLVAAALDARDGSAGPSHAEARAQAVEMAQTEGAAPAPAREETQETRA
jgi:hypothetical protein